MPEVAAISVREEAPVAGTRGLLGKLDLSTPFHVFHKLEDIVNYEPGVNTTDANPGIVTHVSQVQSSRR